MTLPKAKNAISAEGLLGSPTRKEGDHMAHPLGGTQHPSLGTQPGPVGIPIGSLVYYYTADPGMEDVALVVDRKECPIAEIIHQANPECWHSTVYLLQILFLVPDAPARWRPQQKDWSTPGLWNSYWPPGLGWVLERGSHLPGQDLGPLLWRVLE